MFRNKKTALLSFVILVIVLIAVGVWIGLSFFHSPGSDANASSPYTAVYLTSGDVYFGKLSWFPRARLTDAWYLTRTAGANGQTQVGIAPFVSSFWGPAGDIYLNWQSVLFYAPVKNGSQLVQAFENPQAAEQSAVQQQPSGSVTATTTAPESKK